MAYLLDGVAAYPRVEAVAYPRVEAVAYPRVWIRAYWLLWDLPVDYREAGLQGRR